MADLGAIRVELAARAANVVGLRTSDVLPTRANPPQIGFLPRDGSRSQTFDGLMEHTIEGWVFVSMQDNERAQRTLDDYLDALIPAVENNVTTAGVIHSVRCSGYDAYGTQVNSGDVPVLAGALVFEVLA